MTFMAAYEEENKTLGLSGMAVNFGVDPTAIQWIRPPDHMVVMPGAGAA